MLFLGTFLGCDVFCIPCTPIEAAKINEVNLTNGKYERFHVTKVVTDELNPVFQEDYDFDTVLYARFDKGTSNAGNVDWDTSNVSHLLIKRREKDSFHWTTIKAAEITDPNKLEIIGTDYTNSAKTTYEYAVVPSFYGIEGGYDIAEINSDFNELFIIGCNEMVHTLLSDCYLDTTTHSPSSTITTIQDKYPTIVRNTCASYSTGTFNGHFLKYDSRAGNYDTSDKAVTDMQKKVISFLSDGNAKLLKHFDGRTLFIHIDPDISNSAVDCYANRNISFCFTEIGDPNSSEDLYMNGFSDVTEEWW